jgi:hypothetical protein
MQPLNLQLHANITHLQIILVIFTTILKSLAILVTMLQLSYDILFFHPSIWTIYNIVFMQEWAYMSH